MRRRILLAIILPLIATLLVPAAALAHHPDAVIGTGPFGYAKTLDLLRRDLGLDRPIRAVLRVDR